VVSQLLRCLFLLIISNIIVCTYSVRILQTYTKEMEDCQKERDGLNDTIVQLKQVRAVCGSLDDIPLGCSFLRRSCLFSVSQRNFFDVSTLNRLWL